MLGLLHSAFNEIISHGSVKSKKPNEIPKYTYRDELNKKPSLSKLKGETEPFLQKEESEKMSERKGGLRIKILMTKEEANRLLSKCKDGGVLEFKDVAHELSAIPINRVSVVSNSSTNDRILEGIPEKP